MSQIPKIGERIMRTYGRRDYVDYGEIGTVTAHNSDGTFQMTLDQIQPFHRWMFGSKSKPTDNGGHVHEVLTASEVKSLRDVYFDNANRFRALADDWEVRALCVDDPEEA